MTENSPARNATQAPAPTLHPADVFRAQPRQSEPQGGEFAVVRTRQSRLRALAWWIIPAALLCLIPAIVVWWRPEPSYLVGATWLIALLCVILVIAIGAAVAWFVPIGRTGTVLNLDDTAITFGPAAGTEQVALPWERVRRCEIAGRLGRTLIVTVAEERPPEPEAEPDEPHETADEPLPPLDFEADPPPPTVQPSREVFEQIRPLEPAKPEPADEPQETAPAEPAVKPRRGERWNEHFYGTPYAVSLWATSPKTADVQAAIEAYSAGRFAASSRRLSKP
ncbi:hypothetical protein EK0264_16865 [Epidermidibacterium keratini]|uniref:Uncharacterized protein n=1 Tax=Epidermidibacterium keratini TaxID=1891644 RepID=A0A7L4YTC9_9ACTN|nr:hypothetical protein [Epidermidibacterium keratini]QHC01787.1 hypothetical protein EK0264_16865 [Epidermidibacterium keratini]